MVRRTYGIDIISLTLAVVLAASSRLLKPTDNFKPATGLGKRKHRASNGRGYPHLPGNHCGHPRRPLSVRLTRLTMASSRYWSRCPFMPKAFRSCRERCRAEASPVSNYVRAESAEKSRTQWGAKLGVQALRTQSFAWNDRPSLVFYLHLRKGKGNVENIFDGVRIGRRTDEFDPNTGAGSRCVHWTWRRGS
jgi:hypothetical protein